MIGICVAIPRRKNSLKLKKKNVCMRRHITIGTIKWNYIDRCLGVIILNNILFDHRFRIFSQLIVNQLIYYILLQYVLIYHYSL